MANENNSKAGLYLQAIKSFEAGSVKLATWSLSVFGGSLLIIVGDSYLRPSDSQHRLAYLLFLIGWALIGWSMYQGFKITRHTMVLDLHATNEDALLTIFQKCNKSFANQLRWFQWGLFVFGIWLVLYLLWWIYTDMPNKK